MFNRRLPPRALVLILEVILAYLMALVLVAALRLNPFMLGSINMTQLGVTLFILLLFEVIPWRKLIK